MKRRKPLSRTGTPARKTRVRQRSKKRASEIVRTMGSKERRRFVASLPCAACGDRWYSANAHLLGPAGMGLKKPANTIGPLCIARDAYIGCHMLYDEHRSLFEERFPNFNPRQVAADTQAAWLAFSGAQEQDA